MLTICLSQARNKRELKTHSKSSGGGKDGDLSVVERADKEVLLSLNQVHVKRVRICCSEVE
jgi:hypothetical protein